jgi:hypothetical protein
VAKKVQPAAERMRRIPEIGIKGSCGGENDPEG